MEGFKRKIEWLLAVEGYCVVQMSVLLLVIVTNRDLILSLNIRDLDLLSVGELTI